MKWLIGDKENVEETVNRIERLKFSVALVLNQATLAAGGKTNDTLMNQKTKAVIDWLTPLNFLAQQKSIIGECSPGTGAWFLASRAFHKWRSEHNLVLRCPGMPGAGKTCLASIVVESLRDMYHKQNVAVLMVYCSYSDPETQSVRSLMASLLKQCVQHRFTLDKDIEESYDARAKEGTDPTLKELEKFVSKAISTYDRTFIVLDALDELLNEDARTKLIESLCALEGETNLLVTSRPVPAIEKLFGRPYDCICCDVCDEQPLAAYWHCTSCDREGYDECLQCYDKAVGRHTSGHVMKKCFSTLTCSIEAADEDLEVYILQRIANAKSLRQCVSKKLGLQDAIIDQVIEFASGM